MSFDTVQRFLAERNRRTYRLLTGNVEQWASICFKSFPEVDGQDKNDLVKAIAT